MDVVRKNVQGKNESHQSQLIKRLRDHLVQVLGLDDDWSRQRTDVCRVGVTRLCSLFILFHLNVIEFGEFLEYLLKNKSYKQTLVCRTQLPNKLCVNCIIRRFCRS